MGSKSQKCIWMEAGAVEYQLCPLNLNCEKCDFYKEMASGCHLPAQTDNNHKYIAFRKPKLEDVTFQPGYQYLPGHFWFKHVAKNQIRVGMDDVLWSMVCPPEGIIFTDPGTQLRKDSCFAWIIIPHGIVYLKTPMTGRILSHNPKMVDKNLKLNELRYTAVEDKWLLDLEADDADFQSLGWLTQKEYTALVRKDCETIYQTVDTNYSKHLPSSTQKLSLYEPEAERLILEKTNFIELLKNITVNLATTR